MSPRLKGPEGSLLLGRLTFAHTCLLRPKPGAYSLLAQQALMVLITCMAAKSSC